MGAITQLCGRAVQLEKGKLKRSGSAGEVVTAYLSSVAGTELRSSWSRESFKSNGSDVRFSSVRLLSTEEQPLSITNFNESLLIRIDYEVEVPVRNLSVTCLFYDSMNHLVFESMDTDMPEWNGCIREPGRYRATAKIPQRLLRPGRYQVSFAAFVEGVRVIERLQRVLTFDVSGVGYTLQAKREGIVSPVLEWKVCRFSGNELMD